MADTKIIARPWQPQDLIDDLQGIIDEECDNYLNTRRTTLCMARDYLKEHFAEPKWISVNERLPEKWEYTAKSKDGTEYYVRLLIAYKTDIVEYEIGYYDGYKWLTEMPMHIIKDVIAWKPLEPFQEPPKGE